MRVIIRKHAITIVSLSFPAFMRILLTIYNIKDKKLKIVIVFFLLKMGNVQGLNKDMFIMRLFGLL